MAISRIWRSTGNVTCTNVASRPAPSTCAASQSSAGMRQEPRVAEQRHERHGAPDVGQHQPGQGKRRIAEPVDRPPAENEVHEPGRGMVQPLEDLGRYHRRQRPRQKQQREGQAHAGALSAQGQRDQRSQDQLEPHRDDGEDEGHPNGVPEARVAGQERVVVEPDEALDTEDGHALLKREPQHGEGRIDR